MPEGSPEAFPLPRVEVVVAWTSYGWWWREGAGSQTRLGIEASRACLWTETWGAEETAEAGMCLEFSI